MDWLRRWLKKDPPRTAILALVLAGHFCFLVFTQFSSTKRLKPSQKPLVVKTITPSSAAPREKKAVSAPAKSAPKAAAAVAPKPVAKPAAPKKPAEQPAAQDKKAPPIADKKLAKEKNPPTKKPAEEKRGKMSHKLLEELEESLAKLDAKPEKKSQAQSNRNLPKPIGSLRSASEDASEISDYQSSLAAYLQQSLNLPEYGEVKIQITLNQNGSVAKLVVLKTESEKNRKHLETSLPHLRFPRLEGKKKQETFVVTFCNEI